MEKRAKKKAPVEVPDPPDPPDAPSKMGARSKRRALHSKESSEYVIKTSLRKSLEEGEFKEAIMKQIQCRVEAASKGVHRLAIGVHLLLRDYLDNCSKNEDFANLVIPPILDGCATFGRQIALGQEDVAKPDVLVTALLAKWGHVMPSTPQRFPGDRNTFVNAVEVYFTNYKTYLATTFKKRQRMFEKLWAVRHNIPDNQTYILRFLINGWAVNTNLPSWTEDVQVKEVIALHRKVLRLNEGEFVCTAWLKQNYIAVVTYYGMLSNYFQQCERKAILLAPTAHMRAKFIHIDSSVLYGIMKSLKMINSNYFVFTDMRDDHWNSVLRWGKYLTSKQKTYASFTGTIQTDGVAICIHYRRPKPTSVPSTERHFVRNANDRVIGVDPGRSSLFTGVEILQGRDRKVYKLSRAQYYLECGFTKANKRKDKWNKSIQPALDDLSKHTMKGTSTSSLVGYLTAIQKHYDTIWEEYLRRRWGRQRFATYGGKQRTVQKFLESLNDGSGRRIVLAYGDAGFSSNGVGELSVPTCGLVKACAKKYNIQMIDEFRTSQIHHYENVKLAKVKQNGFNVRGLLWCSSTKGCKFVNRDVNAALNMLRCYHGDQERPLALQRNTPKQPDQPMKVLPIKPGAVAKKHRRDPGMDANILHPSPTQDMLCNS